MKGLLFVVFRDRKRARSAWLSLVGRGERTPLSSSRLHRDGLDPLLGVDLSGTTAQIQRERDVLQPFLLWFGAFAVAGLAIDLSGWIGDAGLAATMGLGSLGVVFGTIAVLFSGRQPLDRALVEIDRALDEGAVLVTIPIDESVRAIAERTAALHGGQTVFDA